MTNLLFIWVSLLVGLLLLAIDKRRMAGALTLAYFLSLSLIHVPGVLAYLNPNFNLVGAKATKIGFEITLFGMAAFIGGAVAARILVHQFMPVRTHAEHAEATMSVDRLGWRVLIIGIVIYFVLLPVSTILPSLTAVSSALATLLILGFWLRLYAAAAVNDLRQTLLVLVTVPLLPLATLVTGGFIGYGTSWALSMLAFLYVITKRRVWIYVVTPPIVFLGLSLFVTYFHQRDMLRDYIWYQKTSLLQRLEKSTELITNFEFLDLENHKHLNALDMRLNQNSLVGRGVIRHREGLTKLSYGATVPWWAPIPRALWPDKPSVGGGGDIVTQFTGIRFAKGTSVGAGQVLEFYMNFGMAGVLIGFAVLGFVLMRLDQGFMGALANRRVPDMLSWALPGLALLAPGGNLLEIAVAVISAIIAARLLIYFKILDLPNIRRSSGNVSERTVRAGLRQ
jgi:hypothetical protein